MNFNECRNRYKNQNDISSRITYLTKGNSSEEAFKILLKILDERTVVGSTTEIGFIIGSKSTVCLQKEPFVIIAENLIYEKDLLKSILQSDEYWRSFNYNLRDNQYMVDWTNEWEWNIMKFQLLSTWIMENQSIVLENFYRKLNPNFRCEHIHTERKQWRYT